MRASSRLSPEAARTAALKNSAPRSQQADGGRAQYHDDGAGRITGISGQGIKAAERYFAEWMGKVPPELVRDVKRDFPGTPDRGGTDHVSFLAAGAPAFSPTGDSWSYGTYTWHTNRDTFDKLSFDDLKANATLIAMLAYLASEDATKMPRD